jgi:hypothetical protein
METTMKKYVPYHTELRVRGKGEITFFEAPALKEKPPFYLSDQKVKVMSRGDWVWHRDIAPLISPDGELEGNREKKFISNEQFKKLCRPYPFTEEQKGLLAVMLKERGYEIE